MKIILSQLCMLQSAVVVLAATDLAPSRIRSTSRRLDDANNYNNNYQQQNAYENIEEYVAAKMSKRAFAVTGCSSLPSTTGAEMSGLSYVSYHFCDSWDQNGGCTSTIGDFSVSMPAFAEMMGEYYEEAYGYDSPYECVRYVPMNIPSQVLGRPIISNHLFI